MSVALAQPANCCSPCDETVNVAVPGPQGAAGTNGTNGTDGQDSFTDLAAAFTVPDAATPASATVDNSDWAVVGQIVFLEGAGYFTVVSAPDSTHVVLDNTDYPGNAADGTIIAIGSHLGPGGLMGAAGAAGGGGDMIGASNLGGVGGVANIATSRTNLGLGTAAVLNTGVADQLIPKIDDAAGLTNGEAIFATATGVESKTAATARTALGLGTIATQAASAVAITGGALNGTLGATTPAAAVVTTLSATGNATLAAKLFLTTSAVQSLLAATPISPNAIKVRIAGNGGAVTLVAVPTITAPAADGQLLIIQGNDGTNTVTLQDEAGLAGSQLELGAATRLLGLGDTIGLLWDAATSKWYELFFTNN